MAQARTTKNKSTAKVGGGGTGTRVSKFNLKIVIPIVLVVAALGGFYIFQKSSAGSGYAFFRSARNGQISGGTNQPKGGGEVYMINDGDGRLTTWLSGSEITNTKEVCVHFRMLKNAYVFVSALAVYNPPAGGKGGGGLPPGAAYFTKGTQSYHCTSRVYKETGYGNPVGGSATAVTVNSNGSAIPSAFVVDNIWGR